MLLTSSARENRPRWSVDIPFRTGSGGSGTHTFIIRAVSLQEAIEAAWARANTEDAAARRKGAVIAAQRRHLTARVISADPY